VDWRGFALSTAGMSLIVYGIIQAPEWGWGSAATIGALAAGAVALGLLVAAELRTASPMIDVSLFRNPRVTAAAASVAISFFALLGFIFLVTQYFQVVRGYSPLGTGSGCCRSRCRSAWLPWPGPGWRSGSAARWSLRSGSPTVPAPNWPKPPRPPAPRRGIAGPSPARPVITPPARRQLLPAPRLSRAKPATKRPRRNRGPDHGST
jgi:hypothetical protein